MASKDSITIGACVVYLLSVAYVMFVRCTCPATVFYQAVVAKDHRHCDPIELGIEKTCISVFLFDPSSLSFPLQGKQVCFSALLPWGTYSPLSSPFYSLYLTGVEKCKCKLWVAADGAYTGLFLSPLTAVGLLPKLTCYLKIISPRIGCEKNIYKLISVYWWGTVTGNCRLKPCAGYTQVKNCSKVVSSAWTGWLVQLPVQQKPVPGLSSLQRACWKTSIQSPLAIADQCVMWRDGPPVRTQ